MKILYSFVIIFTLFSCGKKSTTTQIASELTITPSDVVVKSSMNSYIAKGVGGGGAMTSFSISPYTNLWFVGTDMGTLFRSTNKGGTWEPIDKKYFSLTPTLDITSKVGFLANKKTVIFSPDSVNLFRSNDNGDSWLKLDFKPQQDERVFYFRSISSEDNLILLATNKRLLQFNNIDDTWTEILSYNENPQGTFIDYMLDGYNIYHALNNTILLSKNKGGSWGNFYKSNYDIISFTGGRSNNTLTLAFGDRNPSACSDISKFTNEVGESNISTHLVNCGYLWVSKNSESFTQKNQIVGDYVLMAENDSSSIYVTGSKYWIRQYGTKVWRSSNSGETFSLVLHQYNWDTTTFTAWDENKLERSAIALDVGWDDNGYVSFDVNLRDSTQLGGTGFYFLFTSLNSGGNWKAPFTKYKDTGKPSQRKQWSSTGLEVTSVYKLKSHPLDSNIIYAAMADISGINSIDHGETWKVIKGITNKGNNYNSIYDYAFTLNTNEVFAAASDHHDFPNDGWTSPNIGKGGVLFSTDKGTTWQELTSKPFNYQYLSIAYDTNKNTLYAGTQGSGVVVSYDKGKTFSLFNNGLPSGDKIISQIEIDPYTSDVYILLTGNYYGISGKDYSNNKQTGIYKLTDGVWKLLRGTIKRPTEISSSESFQPWLFPTCFAVDFNSSSKTLYLGDNEKAGKWLHSGIWKSDDNGTNWKRVTQYTHPRSILIDKNNSNNVYVAGYFTVDGSWGQGGLLKSKDKGLSWERNNKVPYKTNATSVLLDEKNSNNIFYGFFGSAILHGPKPN